MSNLEERIASRINEVVGHDVEVNKMVVPKNNNVILTGYTVKKVGENISPNIYVDDDMSDDEIVDRVVNAYIDQLKRKDKVNDMCDELFEAISTADNVYARVVPAIVRGTGNEEYLTDAICRPFLDMKIVYRVDLNGGTVLIKKELADKIGIDIDELHKNALKNISGRVKIMSMLETLVKMSGRSVEELGLSVDDMEEYPMYVISNESGWYGSASILLDEVIDSAHDKLDTDNIAIIPSSIHEVICLPFESGSEEYMHQMIGQINVTEVSPEDVLSDSLYIHNRENGWRIVA